jgi:NAD(P)-dependent dehydrogenase (short-subunit alcohol dehydrogenase family)
MARNQTAAVIGAGDFIGAAIAKKLAAEGFTIFVGRRNGDKLAPLVKEIEVGGGRVFGRSLDARKEEEVVSFLSDADKQAPLALVAEGIWRAGLDHCAALHFRTGDFAARRP